MDSRGQVAKLEYLAYSCGAHSSLPRQLRIISDFGAPLFFASPGQVNVQIPWELAGQPQAMVTSTLGGLVSSRQMVNVGAFTPGIFTFSGAGVSQGVIAIAGTSQFAAAGTPALRGGYISIYSTGLGAVTNQLQPATRLRPHRCRFPSRCPP